MVDWFMAVGVAFALLVTVLCLAAAVMVVLFMVVFVKTVWRNHR